MENPNLRESGGQGLKSFCVIEDVEYEGYYGYWAEEPESERQRRKHQGCYFINLCGNASEVQPRIDCVLEQIVNDFRAGGGRADGIDWISDDDDSDLA